MVHLFSLAHILLNFQPLVFLGLFLLLLPKGLLLLHLLLLLPLLLLLQLLLPFLPLLLFLHQLANPPLVLLLCEDLFEFHRQIALFFGSLLAFPANLLVKILNLFCNIFSFGLVFFLPLLFVGQSGDGCWFLG